MRVTLRDIAERVNLSHSTVSFVLNGRMDIAIPAATRERVLAIAKEMGYRPNRAAQALALGRTNMVALWMPHSPSAHFPRVQSELVRLAASDGFEVITRIHDFARPIKGSTWEVDDWPVDGLLMLDCSFPGAPPYSAPREIPLVAMGCFFERDNEHVGIDLAVGVVEAMTHLNEMGCRRIAFLARKSAGDTKRIEAYTTECGNLNIDAEFISTPDWSRSSTRATVREYLTVHGKPDGILCYSDGLALAAMKAVRDLGLRVPDDVLVVGCDGTEEGEYAQPALSTIAQPVGEMCRRAWDALLHRINEKRFIHPEARDQHVEVLKSRLVIRDSSVRPNR
jgi:LacI family transcriptional regulator